MKDYETEEQVLMREKQMNLVSVVDLRWVLD
jgi:hypothetical protein